MIAARLIALARTIARSMISGALALLIATPASAQNFTLTGPWVFASGRPTMVGDVDACRTNAPGGAFWGRQPVITALADVDEDLWVASVCVASATATVGFTVGPRPTWVEFECTLNGSMSVAMPGGTASVGGTGSLDGGLVIGCTPVPGNQVGIGTRPIFKTDRILICMQPGNHTASGELGVTATAPPAWRTNRHSVSNFEAAPAGNPGLPYGLMLILQARGECPVPVGLRFGDLDGDGYFTALDLGLLTALLKSEEPVAVPRLELADVAPPCTGMPDDRDLARLTSTLERGLPSGRPLTVESECRPALPQSQAPRK